MDIVESEVQSNGVPVRIFTITGDIDNRSHQQLQDQAAAAFEAGSRHLLLDLSGVRYVGSQGLRAIHAIFTRYREPQTTDHAMQDAMRAGTYRCPTFKLCGVAAPIRDVLHVAGYDMFLETFPTQPAALASFRS